MMQTSLAVPETRERETPADPEPAITFAGVSKDFGATRALCGADLQLAGGQVHAFVGENGAGKSTCLGVLAGRIPPSSGVVRVSGEELRYGDPRACLRSGIVAIYQELTIVPALSAQANVFLGHTLSRAGILSERRMRARYVELCDEVGVKPVPDGLPAGRLSVAEQQLLEIMRALVSDAKVILLDEPTASLAQQERDALLRLIDRLRSSGLTVVFVSHNLDEVLRIADTITVFREGQIVAGGPRIAWDKPRLVREMLGGGAAAEVVREFLEEDGSSPHRRRARARQGSTPLIRVRDLTVPGAIEDVSFELFAGEVLGIGGLVGSGRTTILRTLAGLEPRASGTLWIDGQQTRLPRNVRQARRLGIALAPEDRKHEGLVLSMDAMNNIALSNLRAMSRLGLLSRRRLATETYRVAQDYGFRPEWISQQARTLSGGNQQKLLLARWRMDPPRVLLADEPTRGIDIGAKAEIMASLDQMASDGLGVIVVSSELEEVSAISDRVLVLAEGRCAGTLDLDSGQITPSRIMSTAFGLEDVHATA